MRKQLTIEATTDVLSGLYNRRYFYDISKKYYLTTIEHNQELTLLMIDIDKFKKLNDTYGHSAGDKVIASFGGILTKVTDNSDIVSRYGGEEFIVLLADTGINEAVVLAERIRVETENNHMRLNTGELIHITVSIGVTKLNNMKDKDIEETIKRCDKALYRSKEQGRNMVSTLL